MSLKALTRVAATIGVAGGLALAGAGAANAVVPVPESHVDAAYIECTGPLLPIGSPSYTVRSFVEANPPGPIYLTSGSSSSSEIGWYDFTIDAQDPAQAPFISYANGDWTIADNGSGTAEDNIPYIGFHYVTPTFDPWNRCASSLSVTWTTTGGQDAQFNGASSLNLNKGQHIHGPWVLEAFNNGGDENYQLNFTVSNSSGAVGTIDPINLEITS